ncbi:hypothetical protein BDZ45DRAFT_669790 [Acephala macrosclerotiorum]|nr:hypothetical protein BDZ45DRAFT_669790 [Acephala macrosclerotiorum]
MYLGEDLSPDWLDKVARLPCSDRRTTNHICSPSLVTLKPLLDGKPCGVRRLVESMKPGQTMRDDDRLFGESESRPRYQAAMSLHTPKHRDRMRPPIAFGHPSIWDLGSSSIFSSSPLRNAIARANNQSLVQQGRLFLNFGDFDGSHEALLCPITGSNSSNSFLS